MLVGRREKVPAVLDCPELDARSTPLLLRAAPSRLSLWPRNESPALAYGFSLLSAKFPSLMARGPFGLPLIPTLGSAVSEHL